MEQTLNIAALSHRPGTPYVCAAAERKVALRLRAPRGEVLSADVIYAEKFRWHEPERRQSSAMARICSDERFDWFSATLALDDDRLMYIFRINAAEGVLYLSEEGVSRDFSFELGYFNCFQIPAIHEEAILRVPEWLRGSTCYQIFPDRFDGDVSGKPFVNMKRDDLPQPESFAGGDLAGITRRLDYLEDLGIRCLYLTPVFQSYSSHKYDTLDYTRVDERFGGNDALRELIDNARKRGMRVLLDGVFNHCSDDHPFFAEVRQLGYESPYHGWFYIDGDKPDAKLRNYRTFGDVSYMPRFNTECSSVIDYFCKIGRYWIEEFGADGWRLDVCDELSHEFLRSFRRAVKAANPDAIILGEIWHDPSMWLTGDQLDGAMNYGLTKALLDLFADTPFGDLGARGFADRLTRLLMRCTDPANDMMLNLLGCHDTHRFLTRVGGDARRLAAAYAVMFFFPGMPMVYYGDEIGMTGGYDPDCRGCFDWNSDNWNMQLRETVKRLTALKRSPALAKGDIDIEAEGSFIKITRRHGNDARRLLLNASSCSETFDGITLPPFGFAVDGDIYSPVHSNDCKEELSCVNSKSA
ncbi:MAG: glycoside hydrolase family 13 protein [Oscillospiraceae bacterium]|nr:glycoside hydrolase family 13 protein [Oscillospiraceae bacterium]